MGLRFNPPPGWPPPPPGFVPPPGWQPDPSWPPAPPGWQLLIEDETVPGVPGSAGFSGSGEPTAWQTEPPAPPPPWAGDFPGGPGDVPGGPATGEFPPGQAYPYGPVGQGPPPPRGTNGFAIASFVLGLLGITVIGIVLGVIFGFVALSQIRRTGQQGRGLAIAGIVLSGAWLVLLVVLGVIGATTKPTQPASGGHPGSSPSAGRSPGASPGPSSGSQTANVFSLRPGQCFQNPPASLTVLGVTYVTVVPCTTPHNAQAFAEFNVPGTAYPGGAALKLQADKGCHSRISPDVRGSKITSDMSLHFLYPLPSSWADGHRTITCLIVSSKSNLTSSLLR